MCLLRCLTFLILREVRIKSTRRQTPFHAPKKDPKHQVRAGKMGTRGRGTHCQPRQPELDPTWWKRTDSCVLFSDLCAGTLWHPVLGAHFQINTIQESFKQYCRTPNGKGQGRETRMLCITGRQGNVRIALKYCFR